MCSVRFWFVFELKFRWGISLSLVSFLSARTTPKKTSTTKSLVDKRGGIGDFQHCIVITRGQEERIPKTANVMGTNIGLRSFSYWFSVFIWFSWILEIWGKCAIRVFHLSLSFYFLWNVVDSYFFCLHKVGNWIDACLLIKSIQLCTES